jgi:hypothetical protein
MQQSRRRNLRASNRPMVIVQTRLIFIDLQQNRTKRRPHTYTYCVQHEVCPLRRWRCSAPFSRNEARQKHKWSRRKPNIKRNIYSSSLLMESLTVTKLCAFCANLFQREYLVLQSNDESISFDTRVVHQSPADILEAVKEKCALCRPRWNQLSNTEQTQVAEVVVRIDLAISVDLKDDLGHMLLCMRIVSKMVGEVRIRS